MGTPVVKANRAWRKSRIAARLILRKRRYGLRGKYRALAESLARDPAVTNRLIDQAIHSLHAKHQAHQ